MRARINYYNTKKDSETKENEDLLDKFLKAKETHPNFMSDREVLSISMTMVLAGAETMLDSPRHRAGQIYSVPSPIHRYGTPG